MTYRKENDGIVAVAVQTKRIGFSPVVAVRSGKQYCEQESERKLRQMIRAMDQNERLIVLDELQRIYDPEERDAV